MRDSRKPAPWQRADESGHAQLVAPTALGLVKSLIRTREHAVERIRDPDTRDSARHADLETRGDVGPVRGRHGAADAFDETCSRKFVRSLQQQHEFLTAITAYD